MKRSRQHLSYPRLFYQQLFFRQLFFRQMGLIASLAIGLGAMTLNASAADSADQRARIVESSLRDLSAGNESAIARQRIEPRRGTDALGNPRIVLQPEPRIESDSLVQAEVESSLHRLRRETVSRQTVDGQKSRVDESLERTARENR